MEDIPRSRLQRPARMGAGRYEGVASVADSTTACLLLPLQPRKPFGSNKPVSITVPSSRPVYPSSRPKRTTPSGTQKGMAFIFLASTSVITPVSTRSGVCDRSVMGTLSHGGGAARATALKMAHDKVTPRQRNRGRQARREFNSQLPQNADILENIFSLYFLCNFFSICSNVLTLTFSQNIRFIHQ